MRNAYEILVGKLKRSDNLGDIGIDGSVILLTRVLKKQIMTIWTRISWLGIQFDDGLV
jgi:hypothetical protein